MPQLYALVDCNNFYVSCERLFNPVLAGKPMVVLSNNDGCIIARSEEAKALGVGMGEPFFKREGFLRKHGVAVFSSNYPLYGDISQRVMAVLQTLEPRVEIYSIDEAFLLLPTGSAAEAGKIAATIRATIRQWVGIPVSIGIGPTKTLAKLANRIAKKNKECGGVFVLPDKPQLDGILQSLGVEDVWGIGHRQAGRLTACGVRTACDLRDCQDGWLRKTLTITGLRTAMELRGVSCLPLSLAPPAKKSITSSRSFGKPVHTLSELAEALATYVAIAGEKLRQSRLAAGCLQVFLATSRFREGGRQYGNSRTVLLPSPSSCTPELMKHARLCLAAIYRPGFVYQKVGVILADLLPQGRRQGDLFAGEGEEGLLLMAAVDRINTRWGRDTVQYGSSGFTRSWKNRQERKSPAYTTNWRQLPVVSATLQGMARR
ncbi:Y-family DNA polymerase [Thiovibrio sp. JS02]